MSRRKLVVGLDLGTSKVTAVMGDVSESGDIDVVGVADVASDGLRRGVVVNIEKTVGAIQQAVVGAERMAGTRTEAVVVSISGPHLSSQTSRGVIAVSRGNREILADDVDRVIEAARAVPIATDRQVLHVIPCGFTVDGQEGVKDAVGMTGGRLEVETQIVSAAVTSVQNVIKCVHQAGLDVEDVVSQGLAAGESVLSDNERELGVCVVDVGAGTTDVVVYVEGAAVHIGVLPVGSGHVTNDIAIGLRTTVEEAETLKLNYGHTLPHVIPPEERIEVRQVGGDRLEAMPRQFLAEIIGPRIQEIFTMAREEVRKSGYAARLPAGVVVTGGGARLMGTSDAAQAVFDSSVRLGLPVGLGGLADRAGGPSFAVATGLVKWGAKLQPRAARQQYAGIGTAYQRTVRWLRDFF